jgi:hypothetical protein
MKKAAIKKPPQLRLSKESLRILTCEESAKVPGGFVITFAAGTWCSF